MVVHVAERSKALSLQSICGGGSGYFGSLVGSNPIGGIYAAVAFTYRHNYDDNQAKASPPRISYPKAGLKFNAIIVGLLPDPAVHSKQNNIVND